MNKNEFLINLKTALSRLPLEDADEKLEFYSEMIDDKVEEGLSEEEAVRDIGPVDRIISETAAQIPLSKFVKEKMRPKRQLRTWEIVLIILGFPVWFPVLAAAAAILISAYIVLWAVIIALWAVFVSLVACSIFFMVAAVMNYIKGDSYSGIALLGWGLITGGLSVLFFLAARAASKGIVLLTRKMLSGSKKMLMKKEK